MTSLRTSAREANKATKYSFTNRGENDFLSAASHKSLLKCRVSNRERKTVAFSKTSFMICLIVLIKHSLDQYQYPGNWAPTLPLTQHVIIS